MQELPPASPSTSPSLTAEASGVEELQTPCCQLPFPSTIGCRELGVWRLGTHLEHPEHSISHAVHSSEATEINKHGNVWVPTDLGELIVLVEPLQGGEPSREAAALPGVAVIPIEAWGLLPTHRPRVLTG